MSFACLISDKFLFENGKFYLEFTLDERFSPALTSIAKLGIGTFSLELENWGSSLQFYSNISWLELEKFICTIPIHESKLLEFFVCARCDGATFPTATLARISSKMSTS